MITRNIKIGNTEVLFGASAATPRIYREKFQRDLLKDFQQLSSLQTARAVEDAENGEQRIDIELDSETMEVLENLAYVMAWQADHTIPNNVIDWLDSIDGVFTLTRALPKLIQLWGINRHTIDRTKKK